MNTKAIIKNWRLVFSDTKREDGTPIYRLRGFVYDHPQFTDGAFILTSAIWRLTDCGDYKIAATRNTEYVVRKDMMDPEISQEKPNHYERLNLSGKAKQEQLEV